MTELQIGLIGLGVIAVFGVVVYNTWLEYRHRKLAQELLQPSQDDVLLGRAGASEREFHDPAFLEPDDSGTVPESMSRQNPEEDQPQTDSTPAYIEPRPSAAPSLGERIEPVLRNEDDDVEPVLSSFPETESEDEQPNVPTFSEPLVLRQTPVIPVSANVERDVVPEALVAAPPEPATDSRERAEPLHLLAPAIDYVAAFEAVEPAFAAQIVAAQQEALARIRKPVHWFGYDEVMHEWGAFDAATDAEFRSIRVGLQLVDRRGPVTEGELSVFHVAMNDLAHQLMAIVDLPQRQVALETAATLDEFCASVDIQIGINVISSGALFPGTKIRALAEAAGMLIDASGRFVRADDDGNILYVLLNQESAGFSADTMKSMTTHGLTFLLDVPTVSHGDRVFNQMVDQARRFADVLKGVLVDDNRRPLSEGALAPIRQQIAQYQSSMAARKLPAGGGLAKRLFS